MKPLADGSFCGICDQPRPKCCVSFSARTCWLERQEVDRKPVTAVKVLNEEELLMLCETACWRSAEPLLTAYFKLKTTFPPFGWVTACSVCGKAVDRAQPHVTLNVTEMEDISTPWLPSAQILDDRDFAVLCPKCSLPVVASLQEEDPDAVEVESSTAAIATEA